MVESDLLQFIPCISIKKDDEQSSFFLYIYSKDLPNNFWPWVGQTEIYKCTTWPVRTDSSQANAMRRLLTASVKWSVKSRFSVIAW